MRPLFTWLRAMRPRDNKICRLLAGEPVINNWQPKDITYAVFLRIVRDKPMHVVDACELQNKLHMRYGSRRDVISRYNCFGLVKSDGKNLSLNYAFRGETLHGAVITRELAIDKLGKKKAKELAANSEMRAIFYLQNELKGVLNETRVW